MGPIDEWHHNRFARVNWRNAGGLDGNAIDPVYDTVCLPYCHSEKTIEWRTKACVYRVPQKCFSQVAQMSYRMFRLLP